MASWCWSWGPADDVAKAIYRVRSATLNITDDITNGKPHRTPWSGYIIGPTLELGRGEGHMTIGASRRVFGLICRVLAGWRSIPLLYGLQTAGALYAASGTEGSLPPRQ